MAPEIGSGKYHKPIDIYAIGVILYEMLTGRVPFEGETVNEVLMKHLTARPDLSMLPEPYRTIVARALAKDPNQRPGRVYDLLPPEDAPSDARGPDHRRGQGGAGAGRRPSRRPRPRAEDVLRIEAEEPVFYIGPGHPAAPAAPDDPGPDPGQLERPAAAGGLPAARPRAPRPRRPGNVRRGRQAHAAPARPAPPAPPAAAAGPAAARAARPAQRARAGRRAGRLDALGRPLRGAPGAPRRGRPGHRHGERPPAARLPLRHGAAGDLGRPDPQQALRDRSLDMSTRRLIALVGGLVVGRPAIFLARALQLGLPLQDHEFFSNARDLEPIYFGVLYAATAGWSAWRPATAGSGSASCRSPGRPCWPRCLTPLWPYERPDGIALAALIATAIQIVSPWSEQAARYAKYVRTAREAKPQGQDRLSRARHWFLSSVTRLGWRQGMETGADGTMKRLFLVILLVMIVAWVSARRDPRGPRA